MTTVTLTSDLVNIFNYKSHPCNLDLWLREPKTNRCHVLTKSNQYVKYETIVINSPQYNKRNQFLWETKIVAFVTLTLDLVNTTSISVHVLNKSSHHEIYKSYVIDSSQYNHRKPFGLWTILFYKWALWPWHLTWITQTQWWSCTYQHQSACEMKAS